MIVVLVRVLVLSPAQKHKIQKYSFLRWIFIGTNVGPRRNYHDQERMPPFSAVLEQLAKETNDLQLPKSANNNCKLRLIEVGGAIIVGAGPSGMASAVCLKMRGISSVVIEKEECIASLWKNKTYDRLKLHIAKEYCELPFMPFPESYPTFVPRKEFLDYLEVYARCFQIQPCFRETVEKAIFCESSGRWHVRTISHCCVHHTSTVLRKEYVGRWLVVATGQNAEVVWPNLAGLEGFKGSVVHSSQYKTGLGYEDKKVMVVGCGNSGMEIALDLANCRAKPSIVVRSAVHVLPREILGRSTFSVAMQLMKYLPVRMVDRLLLLYSRLVLGNTASYGLARPEEGPLELKNKTGKTPVLDVGALAKIRSGDIKILPNIKCVNPAGAEFEDGRVEEFDAIIFATGYRSDVPRWLKDDDEFFSADGLPKAPFPNNWKGKKGLYAAGLSWRGLFGTAVDAQLIARDISDAFYESV